MPTDLIAPYYTRREAQERALAAAARDEKIQRIHLQLADGYAAKAGLGNAAVETTSLR